MSTNDALQTLSSGANYRRAGDCCEFGRSVLSAGDGTMPVFDARQTNKYCRQLQDCDRQKSHQARSEPLILWE